MSHLRRPLAMLLAVLMCLSLFPVSVFAEEPQAEGVQGEAVSLAEQAAGPEETAEEAVETAAEAAQDSAAEAAAVSASQEMSALPKEEMPAASAPREVNAEEGVRHGIEDSGTSRTGGSSAMGVHNNDYPTVTDFVIAEDGQTLAAGDTVHFSMRIHDDSGIQSIWMNFGRSYDNYSLDNIQIRPEYNAETGLYEGEYTFRSSDTPGEFYATFLNVVDRYGYYTVINSSSKSVMQGLLPGSVRLSGEAPAVSTENEPEEFLFTEQGQTLRPGDTLDISFRLPQGLTISELYLYASSSTGSTQIDMFMEHMNYDAATGLVMVRYPLTAALYNGDYWLSYVSVRGTDAAGGGYFRSWSLYYNKYPFSLTEAKEMRLYPAITDLYCDKNGQTLTDGDAVLVRFRLSTEVEVYHAGARIVVPRGNSGESEGVWNGTNGIELQTTYNEETGFYEATHTFGGEDVYGVYTLDQVYADTADGWVSVYDSDILLLFAEDAATPFPRRSAASDLHWTSEGMACFTMPEDGDEADVKFYREDGTRIDWWSVRVWNNERTQWIDSLRWAELTTDRYYFTVTVRGDGADIYDSETVRSDYFDYTAPEAKLGMAALLEWETYEGTGGLRGKVTMPADKTHLGGMQYKFFYSETEEGPWQDMGWSSTMFGGDEETDYAYATFWEGQLQMYGSGYYAFSARLVSDDILTCRNGDWSELSPARYIDADSAGEEPVDPVPDITVTGELTEDVWTLAELSRVPEREELYFRFTPTQSGNYLVLGKDSNFVSCEIYDAYLTPQGSGNKSYDEIYNFQVEAYLSAGSTYYIGVCPTATEGAPVDDVLIAVHKQSFGVNTEVYANAEVNSPAVLSVPLYWSDAALNYTWYRGDRITASARIEGAAEASCTTEAITGDEHYLCVVSDGFFEEVVHFTVYAELRIREGGSVTAGVSGDDILTIHFTPNDTKSYAFSIQPETALPDGVFLNVWLNDAGGTLYSAIDSALVRFTVNLNAGQRHFLCMMLTDSDGNPVSLTESSVIVNLTDAGGSVDPFAEAQELAVGSRYVLKNDSGSGSEVFYWFRAPVSKEYVIMAENDHMATITVYGSDHEVLATTGGDWSWDLRYEAEADEIVYFSIRPTVSEYTLLVSAENHLSAASAAEDWATFIAPFESAELQVIVTADDKTDLTYSWYRYTDRDNSETLFYDSSTDSLLLPSSEVDPDEYYTAIYCEVTDRFGNLATVTFYVHVDNELSVWTSKYTYNIEPGESVRIPFNVSAIDQEGLRTRWLCDGVEMEETGLVLETGPLYESHVYQFLVADRYGNTNDYDIAVRIQNHFKVRAVNGTLYPRYGENAVLEVLAEADDPSGMHFSWRSNYGETLEETSSVLTVSRPVYTDCYADTYTCTVTDKYGSVEEVYFSVYWPADLGAISAQTIQLGETKEVSADLVNEPVWFVFTPDVTANYVLSSNAGDDYGPVAALYDGEGRFVAYNERGQENSTDFRLEAVLEAGRSYYFMTRSQMAAEPYTVTLLRSLYAAAKEEHVTVPRYQSATLEVIAYPEAEGDALHYAWSYWDISTQSYIAVGSDSPVLVTEPVVEEKQYSCTVSDEKGHELQVWFSTFFERPEGYLGDNVRWELSEDGTVLNVTGSGEMWAANYQAPGASSWTNVSRVVVGEGITSVGGGTFMGLEKLSEVELPEGLLRIGTGAFSGCRALQRISLPASLREIGPYTFNGSGLVELALPAALTTLGAAAFQNCAPLTTLYLPADPALRTIPNYCFENCTALRTICYDGTETEWNALLAALTIGEGNEAFTRAEVLFRIERIGGLMAMPDVDCVVLSWGISSEITTDAYRLYRRAGEEEFRLLADVTGRNTLAYTDREVEPGVVYTYYVVGVDSHGRESAPSDTVSASSLNDREAPQVLRMLPASGSRVHGQLSVTLYAQDNIAVTEAELSYRMADSEDWAVFALGEGATLSAALDTTALPDGVLQLRGLARDAAGNESSPLVYQLLVDNTAPAQVTGLAWQSSSVTMTLS